MIVRITNFLKDFFFGEYAFRNGYRTGRYMFERVLAEIIKLLNEAIDQEIEWHKNNDDGSHSLDYRHGYINGLEEVKILLEKVENAFSDEIQRDNNFIE